MEIMHKNVETAQKVLKELVSEFNGNLNCACGSAAENAVVTEPKKIPTQLNNDLAILFG